MSVDKSPVYEVKAVPVEKVYANDYNPNVVAPPEICLLYTSGSYIVLRWQLSAWQPWRIVRNDLFLMKVHKVRDG